MKFATTFTKRNKLVFVAFRFFLFNNKFAVSGAQDSQVFLETLKKSFSDWKKENPEEKLEVVEGQTCTPGEDCK